MTKLEDIGEKGLIDLAKDIYKKDPHVKVGIGDDAAAVKFDEEKLLVVTTDMMIEGIHFTSDIPPKYIGKKVVVANLSDLASMGSAPLGLVYSLGAPGNKEVDFFSDLLNGMNSTAEEHGTSVIGGDLNESERIIISGTAFGKSTEEELILRSGAEKGDIICVTGELGASIAAVKALMGDIPLEKKEGLRRAFYEPSARVEEGMALSKNGNVTAAIDISDGLAADLWQISIMSKASLFVDFEDIPIDKEAEDFAQEQGIDLDELSLFGGEDFELLFTVKPEAWEDLKRRFSKIGTKVTEIGRVKSGEGVYLRRDDSLEELPNRGYEHFRK